MYKKNELLRLVYIVIGTLIFLLVVPSIINPSGRPNSISEKSRCGDNTCQTNETPINCRQDCQFPDFDTLSCQYGSDCVWNLTWFSKFITFCLILIALLCVVNQKKTIDEDEI